jgi:hypothetical protein
MTKKQIIDNELIADFLTLGCFLKQKISNS